MSGKEALDFLETTFHEWSEDKASRLGAALAFYSIFSIGPLLMIAIGVAGLVLGPSGVERQVIGLLRDWIGPEGASAVGTMLANQTAGGGDLLATLLGVAVLLFGASGVIVQLQDALNTIWEVEPKPGRGLLATVKDRALAIAMVLGAGMVLLGFLIANTVLSALIGNLAGAMPGVGFLAQAAYLVLAFGAITLVFGAIFKVLPDVRIPWRSVWLGAAATAALFVAGKYLLGLYLSYSAPGSVYGAAGSLVVLLIWVYYSAQIFFLGAEMTQVYARRYGGGIEPDRGAVPLTERAREQQGLARKSGTRPKLGEPTGPVPPRRSPRA